MKHGFGDEAGDVGGADGSTRYLVIGIILTDDPQSLRRLVARIRKGMRKRLKQMPELKAYHTPRSVVFRLLRKVAEADVEIIALVWRKHKTPGPADPEEGYRSLCALAVNQCLEQVGHLSLVLDKRYTNPRLRDLLVSRITDTIAPSAVLVLQQSESRQEKALQVVDAVTWSIFQKYERGDESLYEIVREKIVREVVVEEIKN